MDGSPGLSGTRIVWADDNAAMCRAWTLALESAGGDVVASPDGFTALAAIADHVPDIVFLEAMLPRLDGFQVCAVLKRNPKFRHIPVILCSAAAPPGARARVAGTDFFLLKPLSCGEILATVERFAAAGLARRSIADGGRAGVSARRGGIRHRHHLQPCVASAPTDVRTELVHG